MFYFTGDFSDIILETTIWGVIVLSFLGLMALFMLALLTVGFFGAIFIALVKLICKLLVKVFQLIFR